MLKPLLLVAALVGLAACQTTTSVPVQNDNTPLEAVQPISAERAVALFKATCGASLPNFANLKSKLVQNGFTHKEPTGTVFNIREDASVKLLNGPGAGRSCSFVYASQQSRDVAFAAYEKTFGPIAQTPLGQTAGYQSGGKTTLVLLTDPTRSNGLNYFKLSLLSQR